MEDKQRNLRPSVPHESWADLLRALETTYTISFKEVCRILRASRPWTNQYVKPFVPCVFINSSQRGDHTTGKINWVRLAAMQLDRPDMTESVWFNTRDFIAFITSAVVSCTKQTKAIPLTYLMPSDRVEQFVAEREDLRQKMKEAKSIPQLAKLSMTYQMLPYDYFTNDSATKLLLGNQARITDRTKAPAVTVPLPEGYMENWQAPHDLKDYGDADETIYRDLFRKGAIRIELQLHDEAGKVGTKIFYVSDPEPVTAPHSEEGYILVTEQAWQQYKKEQG